MFYIDQSKIIFSCDQGPDENIATAEFDAKTIRGENSEMLLKSDVDADNGN